MVTSFFSVCREIYSGVLSNTKSLGKEYQQCDMWQRELTSIALSSASYNSCISEGILSHGILQLNCFFFNTVSVILSSVE